jgi:flagellar protein FliO/FliZ
MTESLIKLFVGLPLVILLAYVSLKLTNKYLRKMGDGRFLQVKETVQIFNRAAVSVVKVGREYHVMSVTDANVQTIKVLSESEVLEFEASQTESLKRVLKH